MEPKTIVKIIVKKLEEIQQRPGMYILNSNVECLMSLLYGLNIACEFFGMQAGFDESYIRIVEDRGWKWLPAGGVVPSMRESGLNSDAIIQELLSIEIEAWRRRYDSR